MSVSVRQGCDVDMYPHDRGEQLVWKLINKDMLHPATTTTDLRLVYNGKKQLDPNESMWDRTEAQFVQSAGYGEIDG